MPTSKNDTELKKIAEDIGYNQMGELTERDVVRVCAFILENYTRK
jgi:hypothetical protein